VRILAGNVHVGWLSVFGASDDGSTSDYLIRLTAAALALELGRDNGSAGAAAARRSAFWERLVSGDYHDAGAARDDASACGIALAPSYVAVALEAETGDEDGAGDGPPSRLSMVRALAAQAFRGADTGAGYLERGSVLLAFVPAAREIDASNARTAAALLPKHALRKDPTLRCSGGIGIVQPVLVLGESVRAAETALWIGRRIYGTGRVLSYDEAGAYALLAEGAGVARLRSFAYDVLAPLRAYDEKHQTELERTLDVYFSTGQNVKTAAAHLNVHRHTVFYRLRQIAEICGRSLDSPHDQLTFRLAVAIDALHSS
jgi:sugar diacid utilization regulator